MVHWRIIHLKLWEYKQIMISFRWVQYDAYIPDFSDGVKN